MICYGETRSQEASLGPSWSSFAFWEWLGNAGDTWGQNFVARPLAIPGWLQRLLCMKCSQPLSLCAHLSVSSSLAPKSSQIAHSMDRKCNHEG